MRLHLNKTLFRQAVQGTADQLMIPAIYVEKDYWVTYALSTIFKHDLGKDAVFKGGTALSKCYNLIERFSEDIDLVVLRKEGESDYKLKAKLKSISALLGTVLPQVDLKGITHKMGRNRKTVHTFEKKFIGEFGQVRDVIILESTWLGYHEPYSIKSIISMVGQMMLSKGQSKMLNEYDLHAFELPVLEPSRTICEKIMSLVRFSYQKNPIDDLKKKIRHVYDLHQLLRREEYLIFFQSKDFDSMLLKVANDDGLSFKSNNQWLVHHPNEALIFKDVEQVWGELKTSYQSEFKNLVYGEFPKEEAILETLKMIQKRLKSIFWTLALLT